eukprot:4621171-Pyramimonas_sp.AAC.1
MTPFAPALCSDAFGVLEPSLGKGPCLRMGRRFVPRCLSSARLKEEWIPQGGAGPARRAAHAVRGG